MESVKKHRDIKLVITEKRNFFVSKPNYDPTKFFSKKKKKEIFINKQVYLRLSIFKISKVVMCEFWYDYVKPKYNEKAQICYMDTDSFIPPDNRRYLRRHCRRC